MQRYEMQYEFAEFSDLIARYGSDFTGRQWLTEQVEARLDDSAYRFMEDYLKVLSLIAASRVIPNIVK